MTAGAPPSATDLQAKTERIARKARAVDDARTAVIGDDLVIRPLGGVELVLIGRARTIGVFPTREDAVREAMAHTPSTVETVSQGFLVVELLHGGAR